MRSYTLLSFSTFGIITLLFVTLPSASGQTNQSNEIASLHKASQSWLLAPTIELKVSSTAVVGERAIRIFPNGDVHIKNGAMTNRLSMSAEDVSIIIGKLKAFGFFAISMVDVERNLKAAGSPKYFKKVYVADGTKQSLTASSGSTSNTVSIYGLRQLKTQYPENPDLLKIWECFRLVETSVEEKAKQK